MTENLFNIFTEYAHWAILISIVVNVIVAIFGLIPSVFVTGANILFFGFWYGTLISFLGESVGAGIAFMLYRRGFKKPVARKMEKFPRLNRLINAPGNQAFYLVFSLRILPFVPSGLITFAAAVGKISFVYFIVASSIGKLPALLIESASVFEIMKFSSAGKLILLVLVLLLFFWVVNKIWKNKSV